MPQTSLHNYVISPYVGVGPVRFGMKPDEVAQAMGAPPRHTSQNMLGGRYDAWDDFNLNYDETTGGAAEIGFTPDVPVFLDGVALFSVDPLAELRARSSSVVFCSDWILFLDLGISLAGFHDGDSSQRALTAFARGWWDSSADEFIPYKS